MVNFKVYVEDKEVLADLDALKEIMPKLNEWGLRRATVYLVGVVQKNFLRGPRPEKLNVRTARLINSIDSEVIRNKDDSIGYIYANAKADKSGYNYPRYWEYDGSKHGGPRPFLRPAVEQYRDRWQEVWRRGIESGVNMFVQSRKNLG